MARKYARGHKAWFECGRCGLRGLFIESVFDGQFPNMRVHRECFEEKHPQEKLLKISDPIALWKAQPEYGGAPPVLSAVFNEETLAVDLSWTEAEIFNARYESYDVYRAEVGIDGEIGDFLMIASYPITYDDFMAILSQTLEHEDTDIDTEITFAYKVVANASNGAGDPDGDFTHVSNIVLVNDTFYLLCENLDPIMTEDDDHIIWLGVPDA